MYTYVYTPVCIHTHIINHIIIHNIRRYKNINIRYFNYLVQKIYPCSYVRICKVVMRRETTLHTLEWSREKQHWETHWMQWPNSPSQSRDTERTTNGFGWTWLGWCLFLYTNDQVSFELLEVSFEHSLWKLVAAIWWLIFSSHTLQIIANNDNHIWGCLAQDKQNGNWFPPCSY